MYRPTEPFTIPMMLQTPSITSKHGIPTKSYVNMDVIYGSIKTYGGTEKIIDGVLSVEDTAIVETWYRPDVKANCRLTINGVSYEILGTPEDISMRHQFLKFKIRAVKGGA